MRGRRRTITGFRRVCVQMKTKIVHQNSQDGNAESGVAQNLNQDGDAGLHLVDF